MLRPIAVVMTLALMAPMAATAQGVESDAPGKSGASGQLNITAEVPKACSLGDTTNAVITITAGASGLADPMTGRLSSEARANGTFTINNSWCNSASTLKITAAPIVAKTATGAPIFGYSRAVNYKATASGWTPTNAVATTNAASDGLAGTVSNAQNQPTPRISAIVVSLSDLSTGGGANLKLVADDNYSGSVTLTLAVN